MEEPRDGAGSVPPPAPSGTPPPGSSPWASTGAIPPDLAETFADIVTRSPEGVVVTDLDGIIEWANPAAAALLGREADGLPGRPLADLGPDAMRDDLRGIPGLVLDADETGPFLTRGLRADGRAFDLSVTARARRDARGRLLGLTMVLRDVADDARLQRALAEAVARSRARFEESVQPQALLDLDGHVVEVNDAACELLGRSREEVVGRDSTELIPPTEPDRARDQLDSLRTGAGHTAGYEATALCQDGRRIPLRVDVTAVRDAVGRTHELAVSLRDMRELRDAERRLASQEAFFRGLHREASDITLVADASGALRYVTPSVTQVLGYDPEEILTLVASNLVHSDDLAGQEERRRRVLEAPGARDRGTVRLQDAEGRWRWFDTTATNCVGDPDIAGIVINLREVTPEIEAEQALRDSEARYRAIAETAQEGILAVSPEGDTLFANERLAEILGLSMEEVYALGGTGIFPSGDVGRAARRAGARRPQATAERSDVPYLHPDGRERILLVSASPLTAADGTVLGSLAMVSDVTEQRAAEETLRRQALHDALTGLPNRLLFVDRLNLAAARQKRADRGAIAVLFLDLDHFKSVNDIHGHQTGDRLLAEVAARLEHAVRTTDTVARLGGDEFAVICEGADSATAGLVASRIQQEFKEPLTVDGTAVEVSMSIGVALSPPHQAEDLLRLADMAMYQAKATARGRVVTYDAALSDETTRHLGLARAVREAVDAGVPVSYQPVVDLGDGSLVGVRVALRWEHPTLGRLGADETFRAAEAAGMAPGLEAVLVRQAVHGFADLRGAAVVGPEAFVMVDAGPGSRREVWLGPLLAETLSTYAVPPDRLRVVVHASGPTGDPRGAAELSASLRELGAGLVVAGIDTSAGPPATGQVGSGVQLSELVVSGLVIGPGLVEHLADRHRARSDAAAVVRLAASLGVPTTADGVTTTAQVAVLRDLGCALGTGPLWETLPPPGRPTGDRSGETHA